MRRLHAGQYLPRDTAGVRTVSASGASLTVDCRAADVWDVTLSANCTFTLQGASSGRIQELTLIVRQDATGGRAVTWPGAVTWLSGAAPILHTGASTIDLITLLTVDGGTTWLGSQANPTAAGSWTTYDCAPTGFSGTPTQNISRYALLGNVCVLAIYVSGTSNATTFTVQAPFNYQKEFECFLGHAVNNGGDVSTPLHCEFGTTPPSKTLTLYTSPSFGTWTASSTKAARFTAIYEI